MDFPWISHEVHHYMNAPVPLQALLSDTPMQQRLKANAVIMQAAAGATCAAEAILDVTTRAAPE